jgi:hypothetical protein
MPQLPSPEIGDYQPQVDLSEPYRKITPEARTGNVGSQIENLGNQWAQSVDVKNRADGAVYAANQMADFRTRTAKLLDNAKQTAAPDANGFTQGVLDQYDKDSSTLMDQAKSNPYATKSLAQGLTQFRNQVADHAINWEAQQGVAFRGNSIQQNIEKLAPVVEADPSQWQSAGNEQMNAINNSNLPPETRIQLGRKLNETLSVAAANGLARQDPVGVITGLNDPTKAHPAISGLSDQQLEQLRLKANDNLGKPVYDALTDGNTSVAQQQLDSVRDIIDPKNAYVLQNQIDARVKEKQNDQKQDIADRLQDSKTGAEYGLQNPVTVTRAELEVLYPKDAQRHWDSLQGLVAAGAKAKEYDQMTPEQVNADVNSSQPTQGGPEVADQVKAFEIRANAADRSLKARQQDPAQFAIDSGAGWKPLDFANSDNLMASLRSRANTQAAVSTQTGVNTPLLSKQEQKQFVAGLASQNPKDLVQTLTTLRATMPTDQSYTALLKQVAPDSPLTAAAGAMLDRPAQGAVPNWYNPSFATNPVVPQRILEGKDILESKDEKGIASKFPMPKDSDLMPQFMEAIGGSNSDLFRGRDKTLETAYASFKAYYAAEASHRGVTNGIISTDIARTAAEGVTNGGATQYGRSELVVPAGMDPTKFEGNMDRAKTSALKAGGYTDSDIAALHVDGVRELGDTLGTGRYLIINGNGDALKSKDGKKPVTIDLNQSMRIPMAIPGDEEAHSKASDLDRTMVAG